MKYILWGLVVLVVLVGGYFLLADREGSGGSRESGTAEGRVIEVDLESVAFDGPALVTIETESGEERVIAVPSMGLPLCDAAENIADVFELAEGDYVEVSGALDEEGRIVPCEDAAHYLRATSVVRDAVFGFEFEYRKGPDGYIVLEDTENTHPDFQSELILFNRAEYEEFQRSADAREGPPGMHVRVYDNPQNLQAPVWNMRNPQETNVGLAFGEPEEAVVGGANAEHFVADGLFPLDTYVVAHGGYIYTLMGMFPSQDSQIYKDFQALVDSFEFIRTADQN